MLKNASQQVRILAVACIISAGAFGLIARAVTSGTIETFDLTVIQFVQGLETSWLTFSLKLFTWIGSGYGVVPITVFAFILLYFVFKKRGQAVLFVVVVISTILSNALLKLLFNRNRPEFYRMVDVSGLSFPSGHTMMAVGLYAMIVYIFWSWAKTLRRRALLILGAIFMVIVIAGSRIYLGVHYPSDIVGGLAASAFIVTFSMMIDRVLHKRKEIL